MQKVKTLSAFLLIYLAVGALTYFIVSVIYGEPFYSFYKVINATALLTGATDKPCGVRTVANPKQLLNGT